MTNDKNISNDEPVKERLKLFLVEKRLKVAEFTEKAGVTKSFLYRGDDMKVNVLIRICKAFPDLNVRWLLGLDNEVMISKDDKKHIEELQKIIELAEVEKLKLIGQVELLKELLDTERKEESNNKKSSINKKNDV